MRVERLCTLVRRRFPPNDKPEDRSNEVAPRWPRDVPTLMSSLQSVTKNLKRVQGEIEDKMYDVLDHGRPDEIFRMGIAYRGLKIRLPSPLTSIAKRSVES
jgi:hypothetical protein